MSVMHIEVGSENHGRLLDLATTVQEFFSNYTVAVFLNTILDNRIILNVGDGSVKFWIDENSLQLIVWDGTVISQLDISYTREALRKTLRSLASRQLVKFLERHQKAEIQTFAQRNWEQFVVHRTGSPNDGWNFNINLDNGTIRGSQYADYLTFWGTPEQISKIIERISEIKPAPINIILPKSTPLSTSGLMTKIDKWLNANI